MPPGQQRPFLCERRLPAPAGFSGSAEDVLKDARLLVQRLLDQERVVGDGERLLRGRRDGNILSQQRMDAGTEDGDDEEGEEAEAAAIRELEEETGYRAEHMIDLGRFHASPGMSSEGFTLLRAEGLAKVGEGGGVDHEEIRVHRILLDEVPAFVARKRAEGVAIDVKLLLLLGSGMLAGSKERSRS